MARLIAWLNTLIPILAVAGGYAIALWQQQAPACLPFWEGCTSISRAVRNGDALFWFRGLMMPLTMLLAFYWILQRRWLNQITARQGSFNTLVLLGTISALALGLYANYLGSDGDFYRFMRRFGITFYFAFGLLGQLLSLRASHQVRGTLPPGIRRWLKCQWALVIWQWLLGLVSLTITIMQPENKYEANNIVEWHFALAMTSFYLFSAFIWKQMPPGGHRAASPATAR